MRNKTNIRIYRCVKLFNYKQSSLLHVSVTYFDHIEEALLQRMYYIGKEKAVPLQAWSGPEDSRKLRFPDFMTRPQAGGKVVSLMYRPPLPLENLPGTHF